DQTAAHDPLSYVPAGLSPEDAAELRLDEPDTYVKRSRESMARHVNAMVEFLDRGAEVFDYGNSLRAEARLGGSTRAFDYPGFVPAYLRPLFCEGKGPFRWIALSGDPADIAATDRALLREFPDDDVLQRWLPLAAERVAFQGLPARICWLGYGERDHAGAVFNELVRTGEVHAPSVIGRDHLRAGSGSCVTPTPATTGPWRWPGSGACACPCSTASMADLLVRRAGRVFGHEVEGQAAIVVRDGRVERVVAERDLPGSLPGDLSELD